MSRNAAMWLVAATLVVAAPCLADDQPAPAAPTDEAAADAQAPAAIPRVSHHHAVRRLTVAQSIDESVRRLTRGLDLDAAQQDRLRQILVDQHKQMMRLRNSGPGTSEDVTGVMLSIYDQTRARIRAMLTEEQRKKYPAAVPRDQTALGQADLQSWMKMQETKRKQEAGASQ